MLTALAVKFKWTNEKGNVDINNRYFSSMAKQYGSDLKSKKANLAREESILLQKIGLLAKYSPLDAAKINNAYFATKEISTLAQGQQTFSERTQKNQGQEQ
jgi:hypothetical protein